MKIPVPSPIVRLSIGLSLLTVSLLLVADFLGFIPNSKLAEFNARKAIAESLAVQVSADVMKGDIGSVTLLMRSLQQQNQSINSLGLRTIDKQLISSAGDHLNHWQSSDEGASTIANVQVPIHGRNGRWGALEVSFKPINGDGSVFERASSIITIIIFILTVGFFVYWMFLKRALNELDPSAVIPDRVSAALNILSEGLVILDKSGRIVFVNKTFENKLGQPSKTLIGINLSDLDWRDTGSENSDESYRLPWQLLLDGFTVEHSHLKLYTKLKEHLSFAVNIAPIQGTKGDVRGAIVTFDDLTELENKNIVLERALGQIKHSQQEITRQNKKLQVLATRDPLTGLLNRRSLFEGFVTLLNEMEESDGTLSCIMLDIDHFKSVNDHFGHATGDLVIKSLAQILNETARSGDLVGRYGGEEFCIVLPGIDEKLAAEIAERIRLVINNVKSGEADGVIPFTASFGVSSVTKGGFTPEYIIDLADKALYYAKKTGRNQVARWSTIDGWDKQQNENNQEVNETIERVDNIEDEPKSLAFTMPEYKQVEHTTVQHLHHRIAELEALIIAHKKHEIDLLSDASDIPNQIVMIDRIKQGIERSLRLNTLFAVLVIDVDASQIIKNTLTETTTNKLINQVAKRLKNTLRSVDSVVVDGIAKIGSNFSRNSTGEFVVLLTDMHKQDEATWVIQRLFNCLHSPVEVEGAEVFLDTRIGVSVYPSDGKNPDMLLSNAGIALRKAKAILGNEICLYYSKETNEYAKSQLYMKGELHRAIERNELSIDYQPVIGMDTGQINSFEALLRWHHPELGVVSPDVFIPIAEHAGLIDEIGNWVLQKACSQLKAWHELGYDNLRIAVNFSVIQFREPDFADNVMYFIKQAELNPDALILEITESELIQNVDMAEASLKQLSQNGVHISLDDFGTGYSSLSYLKLFPINIVKIDKSFLKGFPENSQDAAVVSAIIAMVHSLGLHVIAEGVELNNQLQVLQHLKCDSIQGYLFSEPITREQATILLANPKDIRRRVWDSRSSEIPNENTLLSGVLNPAPGERV
jgi:diguanylate cyclase (GGDEF)-like protein/PAS domain S-box-containing protein